MTPDNMQIFHAITLMLKNGGEAVIRPLTRDDGEALAAFYAGVPCEDIRFYCPHPLDREHALRNAANAESPLEVVLVLETPAQPIAGYAWYRWGNADADESGFGICVSSACQGSGAGKALMTRLLEIAREIGPPVMTLTVQQANARGVALYRQMGFRIIREQTRAASPQYGFGEEPEYAMALRVR